MGTLRTRRQNSRHGTRPGSRHANPSVSDAIQQHCSCRDGRGHDGHRGARPRQTAPACPGACRGQRGLLHRALHRRVRLLARARLPRWRCAGRSGAPALLPASVPDPGAIARATVATLQIASLTRLGLPEERLQLAALRSLIHRWAADASVSVASAGQLLESIIGSVSAAGKPIDVAALKSALRRLRLEVRAMLRAGRPACRSTRG